MHHQHIPINIFQYFPQCLTKLSYFCVIECANWRPTNVLWVLERKEQCKKQRKRMNDRLFQIFWKICFRPFSNSSPILLLFLVHFEWFKTRALQNLFVFQRQRFFVMIKDFKLEILIYFNSPITEHETYLVKWNLSSCKIFHTTVTTYLYFTCICSLFMS
jgi:hypothetical protein